MCQCFCVVCATGGGSQQDDPLADAQLEIGARSNDLASLGDRGRDGAGRPGDLVEPLAQGGGVRADHDLDELVAIKRCAGRMDASLGVGARVLAGERALLDLASRRADSLSDCTKNVLPRDPPQQALAVVG